MSYGFSSFWFYRILLEISWGIWKHDEAQSRHPPLPLLCRDSKLLFDRILISFFMTVEGCFIWQSWISQKTRERKREEESGWCVHPSYTIYVYMRFFSASGSSRSNRSHGCSQIIKSMHHALRWEETINQ